MEAVLKSKAGQGDESPFGIEELFFSHTDLLGNILFGNRVFARVAEYQVENLVQKPHNIIRHPDMPRCVFRLLWTTIKKGDSIAAFVKNRSRTKKYYWVLALVTPFKEGYLSVRLKPQPTTSALMETVYKELREVEERTPGDKGIESATSLLLTRLKEMGYESYNEFMTDFLSKELISREIELQNLGKVDSQLLPSTCTVFLRENNRGLDYSAKAFKQLRIDAESLKGRFSELDLLCINLSANAHRYGHAGATLQISANTLALWGKEIEAFLQKFLKDLEALNASLSRARFLSACALLQTDMAQFFNQTEPGSPYESHLSTLTNRNLSEANRGLEDLRSVFASYFRSLAGLRESLLAIKIIKLSGKVEAKFLPDSGALIQATIDTLNEFIGSIEGHVKKIEGTTALIQGALS